MNHETICFVLKQHKAISKKVIIVNSRYWNRKEQWSSSRRNNLLLFALTGQIIEYRFIKMPRPYSNNLRWRAITNYGCTHKVPVGSSIDY